MSTTTLHLEHRFADALPELAVDWQAETAPGPTLLALDEELAAGTEMLSDGAVSEFAALEDLVVLRGRLADVREERFTRAATRIQRLVIGSDAKVAPPDTTSLRRAAPRVQRAWQGCAPADWGPGTPVAVLYERSPAVLVFRPATGDAQVADLVQCGTGEILRSVTLPGR